MTDANISGLIIPFDCSGALITFVLRKPVLNELAVAIPFIITHNIKYGLIILFDILTVSSYCLPLNK